MLLSNGQELEILPSITTIFAFRTVDPDWPRAIRSLSALGLRRCALFLTGLEMSARQECYRLLLAARQEFEFTLPFVHARYDMAPEEFTFLRVEFGADRFNLHPTREFPLVHDLPPEVLRRIYIENVKDLHPSDLIGFAGACLDVAHLEDLRLHKQEAFDRTTEVIHGNPIGCSHLSVVTPRHDGSLSPRSAHLMTDIHQYDYLKRYRPELLGRYAAIELANSLDEQLEAIRYIRTLLDL